MSRPSQENFERRHSGSTSEYFNKPQVEIDPESHRRVVKIISGEWHVCATQDEVLATILGSCISACICDPYARVGGMNHFLLPGNENMVTQVSEAARYGVFAMESLINGLLKAGGRKDRFEVK